tara:strand:+ start:669 stop:1214 length:546 start_codon:yes stop_codon:yes gene_type:complete
MIRQSALILTLFLTLGSAPSFAQQVYAPAQCDFSMRFPDSYFTQTMCQELEGEQACIPVAKFTKEFETGYLSVDSRCAPLPQGMYPFYDRAMTEALASRILERYGIADADYSYLENEERGIKSATAIAEGKSGQAQMFLILQFWVAEGSALTSEIKLVGQAGEEMHRAAAEIMQSVTIKSE